MESEGSLSVSKRL